ncbi:MAG: asparagine synthase (glutamine-hydrolyzing) [Bacteroidia bacterium]|nr:asparagine synthase (glutamine-hydrolyzing) [Bacteroidia bacterium]
MCGIVGIKGYNGSEDLQQVAENAKAAMSHRGPDDNGTYIKDDLFLGHQRLAIIDLSPLGHQPMSNNDGAITITFNGEIFNYLEIKKQLTEYQFKSNSDTEVMLAAYEKWGIDCLQHFNGMFAFAIHDKNNNRLFIARDRLGIKPLYYYQKDSLFIFSSELRAIIATGLIKPSINKSVIKEYFTYQTVHAPNTMLKDVEQLLPGQYMLVDEDDTKIDYYWNISKSVNHKAKDQDYKSICKTTKDELNKAVERRLIADVPLGAFLSGGIDSSAIVGLMSNMLDQPVKTFNVAFDEEEFSEAKYASIIAKRFKTDHHEIRLTPNDFLKNLPNALSALDHPSGDGPNSYTVSQVTRENGLTVALSGLGGDELFAGYPVFKRSMKIDQMKWLWSLPGFVRKGAGLMLESVKPGVSSEKARQLLNLNDGSLSSTFPISRQVSGEKLLQDIIIEDPSSSDDVLKSMLLNTFNGNENNIPLLSKVSIAEITSYMQNVLLRDTDQMSMAHALEVRVPFLDHNLVEYVLGIPDVHKDPITPKKLLIDSIGDLLPDEIINRKKMGFVFPWEIWLKNDLQKLCDQNIKSLAGRSFINEEKLISRWTAFQNNDRSVRWLDIWIAVVLEHWINENSIDA